MEEWNWLGVRYKYMKIEHSKQKENSDTILTHVNTRIFNILNIYNETKI